jgi:hypothetical protein
MIIRATEKSIQANVQLLPLDETVVEFKIDGIVSDLRDELT